MQYHNLRPMSIANFIPRRRRKSVSLMMHAAKAAKRLERGVDADTVRKRALHDARGTVLRSGICYKDGKEIVWQVRRSVAGRTDQFDLISNGRVIQTGGKRQLAKEFRPHE